MVYDGKEYNDILNRFKKGRAWLNDISIEIVGNENELDPLVLLRAYDEEPTVDSSFELTAQMVLNKEIRFLHKGTVIFTTVYKGGSLSEAFVKAPYLLDTLMKLCYGLMIKKLTPPSEDSEKEEQR